MSVLLTGLFLLLGGALPSLAVDWPQEIEAEEGTIIVYQPQPESLEENVLKARAAMSLELKSGGEPIFGAFWFTSTIHNNGDVVIVQDLKVTKATWPDATEEHRARFTEVVEGAIPDSGFEISQEQLAASLGVVETRQQSIEQIRNDPPKLIFRKNLAVLLLFDGEPEFADIENSNYQRVLNTPFALAHNRQSKKYYLSSGEFWYEADDPMGPWLNISSPPEDLAAMIQQAEGDEGDRSSAGAPPEIVTATEATELICTDGEPNWAPLPAGNMLYVQNTETPWIRDVEGQKMYLLLSGRWFSATDQEGPWEFVRADQLPEVFQSIPVDSDIAGIRSSIAGTEEAEQALLDAQIPETAAINRSEATLEVEYDGMPQFEKIDGTSVAYAVNTGAQVLQIENRFYAVDNGVWFVSDAPNGPWAVADAIPDDKIAEIPPSSPVYNTTYVKVYSSTPEVVYVGYTPGYLWSFPYYGVPIYGTGWYYPPYWRAGYYYPRPPTWGFHVGYNPWTGWNYGVSWSRGFFSVGVTWGGGWHGHYGGCCGGWYGGGYHHYGPVFVNRGDINVNRGDINIGNTISAGNRNHIANSIDKGTLNNVRQNRGNNLYTRGDNSKRNVNMQTAMNNLKMAKPVSSRPNNVLVDSNNIVRQTDKGWQARDNGKWQNLDDGHARNLASHANVTSKLPANTGNQGGHANRNVNLGNMQRQQAARHAGANRARMHRSGGGGRLRRR